MQVQGHEDVNILDTATAAKERESANLQNKSERHAAVLHVTGYRVAHRSRSFAL